MFVSVAQSVHLRTSDGSFKQAGDPVELLAFAFDGGRTTHEMSLDGAFGGFTDPLKPFEARKSHTCTLQPGKPHEFACLAQLPDDTWLRPSTFPGTETPMEISHTLKVTVVYKHPLHQKDLRQLVMTRPVSIASVRRRLVCSMALPAHFVSHFQCSSISSNLVLPEYGADAESDTLKVKPNVSQHNFDCACMCCITVLPKTQRVLTYVFFRWNDSRQHGAGSASVWPGQLLG